MPPVPTEALAGQRSRSCRITLVAADPALQADTALRALPRPPDDAALGRLAHRRGVRRPRARGAAGCCRPSCGRSRGARPGIVGDPDQMGQAMLRSPKLKDVPDPLRVLAPEPDGGGRRARGHGAGRRSGSAASPTAGSAPTSRSWLADTRSGKVRLARAGPRQRRRPARGARRGARRRCCRSTSGGP